MNDKFYYKQGTVVCLADSQPWKKEGSKGLEDGGCARQGAFTGRTQKSCNEDRYALGTRGKVPERETEI